MPTPITAKTSTTTTAAPTKPERSTPERAPVPTTKTSTAPADRYEAPAKAERGLCGTESESSCRVLREGRLTEHKPTVPDAQATEACKGGGRVYILDGLKKDPGDARTPEDFKAMGDARSSALLQDSLKGVREAARQAGCSAVTLRQAEAGEMLGAYNDKKAVAIIHVGHGDQDGGRPVGADGKAMGADALDKDQISKRLRSVDNIVCQGGKSKAALAEVLPKGVEIRGPDAIIQTGQAQELAKEAAEKLRATLAR